jgi:hypothetical protein
MNAAAELSSLATSLEELVRRVTGIADSMVGTDKDNVAMSLYEVERSLGEAGRRLARLVDAL